MNGSPPPDPAPDASPRDAPPTPREAALDASQAVRRARPSADLEVSQDPRRDSQKDEALRANPPRTRSRWRWGAMPAVRPEATPDWIAANPRAIAQRLAQVQRRTCGGWFVLDASRRIGARPRAFAVAGQHLIAWRDREQGLRVAPQACPHMGASLAGACVRDAAVVCPWHGLALGPTGHGAWRHLPSYDDGVLAWVQLPTLEARTDAPQLPARPTRGLDAVICMDANCDPQDIIANRLDPWHGQHFHPYSFGALEVVSDTEQALELRVEKRIFGSLRVEVDASFHCPDARTIVMTITDGEGQGSVVETHATPISPGKTRIIEATIANSSRPGFALARALAAVIRPLIRRSARRLWVDDCAYAERTYWLRQQNAEPDRPPGRATRTRIEAGDA